MPETTSTPVPAPAYNDGPPFEWDRPGVGPYADGSLRIITSRDQSGAVTTSHKAGADEAQFVLLWERAGTLLGVVIVDRALLSCVAQLPQRQDSTNDQLRTVQAWANRLGCYDAADVIRGLLERSSSK